MILAITIAIGVAACIAAEIVDQKRTKQKG